MPLIFDVGGIKIHIIHVVHLCIIKSFYHRGTFKTFLKNWQRTEAQWNITLVCTCTSTYSVRWLVEKTGEIRAHKTWSFSNEHFYCIGDVYGFNKVFYDTICRCRKNCLSDWHRVCERCRETLANQRL